MRQPQSREALMGKHSHSQSSDSGPANPANLANLANPETLDIFAIGHATWDLLATVPAFPVEDEKQEITAFAESGGGPAATAACVAARWGLRVAFAGVLGADRRGQAVLEELAGYGVDCALVERRADHQTPTSLVIINAESGSRTIINHKQPTAPLQLDAAELPRRLAAPPVLLFDGHELVAAEAALAAFPRAGSILDAGSVRPGTVALAGRVTHLAVSMRFARQLTSIDPRQGLEAAERALAHLRQRFPAPQTITITLAEQGALTDEAGGCRQHFAAPAVQVVETTGAGDIWHGALAYALARGATFGAAASLATAAASDSVTRGGGRASMPARAPAPAAWQRSR
jgi:sugar/nucleoside kinase (ribokinase family)